MSNRAAAGTTVTFAGGAALGTVKSITCTENGDEIDVTRLSAGRAEFDVGQSDLAVTLEITGAAAAALSVGDLGAVVITPNDASGAITFANMVVTSVGQGFPGRGEITSTVSLKAAYT